MHLKRIAVKNFRLLHDVELLLEPRSTVIVGRNNSGKTSLTEVMRRVLEENNPTFRLEDFSFGCHEGFWNAFLAAGRGEEEIVVRTLLPQIEIQLTIEYGLNEHLGQLGDFIVDVNEACTTAVILIRYALSEGKLSLLFEDLVSEGEGARAEFFRVLRERIPKLYSASIFATDPMDSSNLRAMDGASFRALIDCGFISAQRGLDDSSHKERVVLGKVLENLFTTAKTNPADAESYNTAQELEDAVQEIQGKIEQDFNRKLDALLPALSIFGYPGLTDPQLRTETALDVARLLTNHTRVRYTGKNGVHLPEAYNGLGVRNIILILLQLREFFKRYEAKETSPAIHLIFIEEPEVHLHPQMQEVFIRKLGEIVEQFGKEVDLRWPVQFVVSTHSSHVANEAHFETIRYFLSTPESESGSLRTIVKDLRQGLSTKDPRDKEFLHQYMTLTRCDLFFADKAILIEGTTERLLLPRVIRMIDAARLDGKKLGSQYLSIMEVGGAYAHLFFDLLAFLELPTLVITDIDAVRLQDSRYVACNVSLGERTSNACIKAWFDNADIEPRELLRMADDQKVDGRRRIAFQLPEQVDGPCGRSFEDAFMLANANRYAFPGQSMGEREEQAWSSAQAIKKSQFAIALMLDEVEWEIPRYIREGLLWLSGSTNAARIQPPVVRVAA